MATCDSVSSSDASGRAKSNHPLPLFLTGCEASSCRWRSGREAPPLRPSYRWAAGTTSVWFSFGPPTWGALRAPSASVGPAWDL